MLIQMNSEQDKKEFAPVAELLSISDKPLLWDGKRKAEVTFNTNREALSIQRGEKESALLAEWNIAYSGARLASPRGNEMAAWLGSLHRHTSEIENELLERLKAIPLQAIDEPATRADAACAVLRKLLQDKKSELPSTPKLVLFHLMMLALADGIISSIEYRLLNEFKTHYSIEDYIFDDILERAESMHRETQKTISIIFE